MNAMARHLKISSLAAFAALLGAASGVAQETDNRHSGRAAVYSQLQDDSLEQTTTPDRIIAVTRGTAAPMEIWRALEHGERVECLDCIPYVSKLLYAEHAKTREIAAWWLRRRVFGVFGPGEVYSQVVATLNTDPSEFRRAYAAEALGEFLTRAGIKHVANAVVADTSPVVRERAVYALVRLNSAGPGDELAQAMSDDFVEVRLAAVQSASRVNVFSSLDKIVALFSDEDARVRRNAAEAIGAMRVSDAVLGLTRLADPAVEDSAAVRIAAVAALGQIGDPAGLEAVQAAESDPDYLVQAAARIALRRL
jgi:HEAT repeat protein